MPKGAFVVSRIQGKRDIDFQLVPDYTPPEDQLRLRDEIDRVMTVLRMLFPKEADPRFEEYFRQLLSLAQTGLVGDSAQPELAKRALVTLKNDIIARESGRVKSRYMRNLGKKAFLIGAISLLAALILQWLGLQLQPVPNFLLLWTGCMAGVWLSFAARKRILRFEDLHILERDRLEPMVRLIFAGLLTTIFGLLFSTGAVFVKVGGISLADFTHNNQLSLLLGAILGFSEKALPSALSAQAISFLRFDKQTV